MRGGYLIAALFCTTHAAALAVGLPARSQAPAAKPAPSFTATSLEQPVLSVAPADQPLAAETEAPGLIDPVVALIRAKLSEPDIREGADAGDLAALEAFYARRAGAPLWITDMGFSARGQRALFEIEKARDWGLETSAFELPDADALPPSPEAQASAEIKLALAILKYARFARGGRLNPREVSRLFDQTPPLRDPQTVLSEIAAADAPDAYLRSLHPKHEQFARLRQALLKARESNKAEDKPRPDTVAIKRILVNMERWRWMPEDMGAVHVWNNAPEFMVYVIKDGKTIYADKTQVGTIKYATPVFTADMKTIVFNPDWIAPPTILSENLQPALRRKDFSVLKTHKFSVSYNGAPVDATKIDWGSVNIHDFTFTQRAGPHNVLGKAKFLYPNKHVVYMHDTHDVRRKFFAKSVRAVGHECVRMARPQRFAEVLLAQDKGWGEAQVKELWQNSVNKPVSIERKIPVHMVYFTVVADEAGKLETFADLYGLDKKLAAALFGSAKGFPPPPPEAAGPPESEMQPVNRPQRSRPTAASRNALQQAFRTD